MFSIQEVSGFLDIQASQITNPLAIFSQLLTDSRKVGSNKDTLFFALKGLRHDAHQFIPALYLSGIKNFVVEDVDFFHRNLSSMPEANILLVSNSLRTLQIIASKHRQKFHYPVFGITGSNGKTIVKEWLSQLLNEDFFIIKSPKSYNSQIGVPLSVWQMNDRHQLGIFEAGISQSHEMQYLAQIIQPDYGIFTNIGAAHDASFDNRIQKIQEKLLLFQDVKLLFYCKDYIQIQEAVLHSNIPQFTWSRTGVADLQILRENKILNQTEIKFLYRGQTQVLLFPFTDKASIENAIHCLAVLLFFNIPLSTTQDRILRLRNPTMRLALKEALWNSYLIDDSYNNDPEGLQVALDFLHLQQLKPKKVLILSDFVQASKSTDVLYNQIGQLIEENHLDTFIGIGSHMQFYKEAFPKNTLVYENTEDFLATLKNTNSTLKELLSDAQILIKGARTFAFEKIAKALEQKSHETVLEINLDALVHNLNFYRSLLQPKTKIMAMVKALAYGAGSIEVAQILSYNRVDYLAVAYTDEGVALRQNGIKLPILVLNPQAQSFDKLVEYQLEPEIYSFKILNEFLNFTRGLSTTFDIQLKIDTGMRRLGFEEKDIEQLILFLRENPLLRVKGIFSHLAASDEDQHDDFSSQQIQTFLNIAKILENGLGYSTLKHLLNSPGIVRFPEAQLDMVRLGIGLYGIETNQRFQEALEVVASLKTTISQIKNVPKGSTVGYGRAGKANQDSQIATIAIGYADGLRRQLSNGHWKVMINGQLAPIIGRICMDMTMIDITGIEAQEGDQVVIFGQNPNIQTMANTLQTIPYEILTSVGDRVKRIFFTE